MATDAQYIRLAMRIIADFSGTVAIPAVLAALAGQWLDERYATEPRYLIVLLIAAFLSTGVIIKKKAKHYGELYEKLNKS